VRSKAISVLGLTISLIIRLLLIVLSEIQDKVLSLKYTDIDYVIFTDGASYVSRGMSPYLRETYRYTPLKAIIMLPNVYLFPQIGKILFSVLDVMSIHLYLINQLYGLQKDQIVCHYMALQSIASYYFNSW
jgi:phosphatidylinositol glycan class M